MAEEKFLTRTSVGTDAWACPGAFTTGQAAAQCAAGFSFCTLGAQIDLPTAAALTGFYAADVPAYWTGTKDTETCVSALGNQLLYGVGMGGRAGTKRCSGFPTVIDVFNGSWTSANGSLASASNTSSGDGVLCCR